jgi:hypothetical protein
MPFVAGDAGRGDDPGRGALTTKEIAHTFKNLLGKGGPGGSL